MNESRKIQMALDNCLSGSEQIASCQAAVLGKIHSINRAPKRLSLAMALAIALLLAAVGALAAAIFSGREFAQNVLAPMVQEDAAVSWTSEQQAEILRLAQENGFALTDEMAAKLDGTDTVYKEELLRAFVKLDLGFTPASWPLADQAWYDELLVRCGLAQARTRFLPEEGEISEEAADSTAKAYIAKAFGCTDDLTDPSAYSRYVQYMLTTDESGQLCRRWDIEYVSTVEGGQTYCVLVRPDGSIVQSESTASVPENNQPPAAVAASISELIDQMDDNSFYTPQRMASFKQDYGDMIGRLDGLTGTRYSVLRKLCLIPYALPKASDISQEDALDKATQAAKEHGWTDEWLGRCKYSVSCRVYAPGQPEWRVCYKLDKIEDYHYFHEGAMPFGIVVNLDAHTGEVIHIWQLDEMDLYSYYCEFPDRNDAFESVTQGVG